MYIYIYSYIYINYRVVEGSREMYAFQGPRRVWVEGCRSCRFGRGGHDCGVCGYPKNPKTSRNHLSCMMGRSVWRACSGAFAEVLGGSGLGL